MCHLNAAGRQRQDAADGTGGAKMEPSNEPMRRAVLVHNPDNDICCGVELTPTAGQPVDAPTPQVCPCGFTPAVRQLTIEMGPELVWVLVQQIMVLCGIQLWHEGRVRWLLGDPSRLHVLSLSLCCYFCGTSVTLTGVCLHMLLYRAAPYASTPVCLEGRC